MAEVVKKTGASKLFAEQQRKKYLEEQEKETTVVEEKKDKYVPSRPKKKITDKDVLFIEDVESKRQEAEELKKELIGWQETVSFQRTYKVDGRWISGHELYRRLPGMIREVDVYLESLPSKGELQSYLGVSVVEGEVIRSVDVPYLRDLPMGFDVKSLIEPPGVTDESVKIVHLPRYVDMPQPGISPIGGTEYLTKEKYFEEIRVKYRGYREDYEDYIQQLSDLGSHIVDVGFYDISSTPEVEKLPGTWVKLYYAQQIISAEKQIQELYNFERDIYVNFPKVMPYQHLERDVLSGEILLVTDPMKKTRWEFEQQPPITQIGRTVISTVLYVPKLPWDWIWGGITGGPTGAVTSAVSWEQERQLWESGMWEARKRGDIPGVAIQAYTSPLAIQAYFLIGSELLRPVISPVIQKIKPVVVEKFKGMVAKGEEIFGKYVPQMVKEYPGRFADIRLAREMWKGYQHPGMPSYITPGLRGELLMGGRVDPFLAKPYFRTMPSYEQFMYKPVYGIPSRYMIFEEEQALSSLRQLKLDILRKHVLPQQIIKTETTVFLHPKKPWEGIFYSEVVGRDVFSIGTIEPSKIVSKAEIHGTTYYKLSPENVFYQEKSFKAITEGKYIGDVGEYSLYGTRGASVRVKEIVFPEYPAFGGYTHTKVGTGFFKPDVSDITGMGGVSLQKNIYAGETFIEKGFLKSFEQDISLVESRGVFYHPLSRGKYLDTSVIIKPKLKGLATETGYMGFDTSGITRVVTKDIVMPGGIGVEKSQLIYPQLLEPLQPLMGKTVSLRELEFWESGISGSSFWTGVKPVIGKASVKLTPVVSVTGASLLNITGDMVIPEFKSIKVSGLRVERSSIVESIVGSMLGSKVASKLASAQISVQAQVLKQVAIQTPVISPVTVTPPLTFEFVPFGFEPPPPPIIEEPPPPPPITDEPPPPPPWFEWEHRGKRFDLDIESFWDVKDISRWRKHPVRMIRVI